MMPDDKQSNNKKIVNAHSQPKMHQIFTRAIYVLLSVNGAKITNVL